MQSKVASFSALALLVNLSLAACALAQTPGNKNDAPQTSQTNQASEDSLYYYNRSNSVDNLIAQGQGHAWAYAFGPDARTLTQTLIWRANASSGMGLVAADDALRAHLKLPKDQGLVVTALEPHSSAATVGIRQNDVLVKLGDSPLGRPEDLDKQLRAAADKPITLSLLREGRTISIPVQPQVHVSLGPVPAQPAAHEYWIGVSVSPLEPALRAQLKLNHGLLVTEVSKDSPAEQIGLKINDILLTFGGKPLSEQSKLVEAVQSNGENLTNLVFVREGGKQTVLVTPRRRPASGVSWVEPSIRYDIVNPGVVFERPLPNEIDIKVGSGYRPTAYWENIYPPQGAPWKSNEIRDATAALSKRLEELDAEIGKLHKALEEFRRATNTMQELKKAGAGSKNAPEKK